MLEWLRSFVCYRNLTLLLRKQGRGTWVPGKTAQMADIALKMQECTGEASQNMVEQPEAGADQGPKEDL